MSNLNVPDDVINFIGSKLTFREPEYTIGDSRIAKVAENVENAKFNGGGRGGGDGDGGGGRGGGGGRSGVGGGSGGGDTGGGSGGIPGEGGNGGNGGHGISKLLLLANRKLRFESSVVHPSVRQPVASNVTLKLDVSSYFSVTESFFCLVVRLVGSDGLLDSPPLVVDENTAVSFVGSDVS